MKKGWRYLLIGLALLLCPLGALVFLLIGQQDLWPRRSVSSLTGSFLYLRAEESDATSFVERALPENEHSVLYLSGETLFLIPSLNEPGSAWCAEIRPQGAGWLMRIVDDWDVLHCETDVTDLYKVRYYDGGYSTADFLGFDGHWLYYQMTELLEEDRLLLGRRSMDGQSEILLSGTGRAGEAAVSPEGVVAFSRRMLDECEDELIYLLQDGAFTPVEADGDLVWLDAGRLGVLGRDELTVYDLASGEMAALPFVETEKRGYRFISRPVISVDGKVQILAFAAKGECYLEDRIFFHAQ